MRRTVTASLIAIVGIVLVRGVGVTEARRAATDAQALEECQPAFTDPVAYEIPGAPIASTLTDLNNDGASDLVVTYSVNGLPPGGIAVLLGTGSGFGSPATTVLGERLVEVSAADFNGDGRRDMVVSRQHSDNAGSIIVLFGDGTGGFAGSLTRDVGTNPFAVIAGDFTQDGHADVVVSSEDIAASVSIMVGDGAGNFGPLTALQTGLRPTGFAAGDFNGDGRRDLAVATADFRFNLAGFVELRLANTAGGFDSPAYFEVGWQPTDLITADFNEDGRLDVAAANAGTTISVLLGDGAGSFAPQTVHPVLSSSTLAAADLDGDGHVDLAVSGISPFANPGRAQIDLLLGAGDGTFAMPRRLHAAGVIAVTLDIGDFDADGRRDLVSAGEASPNAAGVLYGICGTPADISLAVVDAPGTALAFNDVRHVFAVENRGPEAASVAVEISVTSPRRGRAEAVPSQGSCTLSSEPDAEVHRMFCDLGNLSGTSGTATIEVVAREAFAGTLTSTASLLIDNPHFDPTPADKTASAATTIFQVGGLFVSIGTQGGAMLTWNRGVSQAGYSIGRWAGGDTAVLPENGVPLPPGATSFVDPNPVADKTNCYSVVPIDSTGTPFGRSDLVCMTPGSASPPGTLEEFTLGASQVWPLLEFTWMAPGNQTEYVLFITPLDGSPGTRQRIDGRVTSTLVNAPTVATCYALGVADGSTLLGTSSVLCFVPGFSTL